MSKQRTKTSLLGIVLFLWGATLFAQPPDTLWTKTYGGSEWDEAFSVQQTSDRGYIVTGYTKSFGAGDADVWLLKTDPNGDTLWTKTYGGAEYDQGSSVYETLDGGYIVTGGTESFGAGEADVWLLKTDANGDTLWTRTYGDTGYDAGSSVCETSDRGYIIVGYTASGEIQHVYVIKTDADGDTIWTRTYGESGFTRGSSVKQTSDGSYIIAGERYISSEVVSSIQVYLIKTDANGDSLWTRTYGEPAGGDYGASVCETSDGSYIITGSSYYSGRWYEVLLLKTDANGDSLWARTYGQDHRQDHGRSVCETSDGGYMIAGSRQTDVLNHYNIYLMKTDENGEVLWTRDYGYPKKSWNQGYSVQETSDGGYIVAGGADYLDPPNRDVCLLKLEPDVGIEENKPSRETFVLSEPEPNPFAEQTSIKYSLPRSDRVRIAIYDPLGRRVRTLLDSPQSPGTHTITWEGTDDAGRKLSSGLYFIRIVTPQFSRFAKVVMLR